MRSKSSTVVATAAYILISPCVSLPPSQVGRQLLAVFSAVNGRDHDSSGSRAGDNDAANDSAVDEFDAADFEPIDNCIQSVLSETPEFTNHFKRNYERWLEDAVFRRPVDWEAAVLATTPQLERMLAAEKAA